MSEQKKTTEVVAADEKATVAEPEKEINTVLTRCLLLTAKANKNADKIGVALLDYSAKLPNGHYDVLGNDVPVITTWLPMDVKFASLLTTPVFTEVGCLVAGNGEFRKLVKVLSDDEFKTMQSIMGV